jgi:hypothetical protein
MNRCIISEQFVALSRAAFGSIYDSVSLENLQYHLLLCIRSIGHGKASRRLQLDIANRISQMMRLMDEDTYVQDTTATAEMERRTVWCCFALDSLLANGNNKVDL